MHYWDEALRQLNELALAGQQWAAEDSNPREQFVLHGMFLAVLQARKEEEDKVKLLFLVEKWKVQQDCYPWCHHLPVIGALPRDWKWGADSVLAMWQ